MTHHDLLRKNKARSIHDNLVLVPGIQYLHEIIHHVIS